MKRRFLLRKFLVCLFSVVCLLVKPICLSAQDNGERRRITIGLAVLKDNLDYHEGRDAFVNYLEAQSDFDFEFKLLDAYGDVEAYEKGIQRLVEEDHVDLIFTTGTRSTLPVMKIVPDLPVVFTAVADPVQSHIIDSLESSKNNLTGTHCGIPALPQVKTIKRILPHIKTLGIVYTKNESNAEIQTQDFINAAERMGLTVVTSTVAKDCKSEEEIEKASMALLGKADVFVAHQDTSLSRYGYGMIKVAEKNNIPTYVTLSQLLSQGAMMSLGVDFKELGRLAGEKAMMIIRGQKRPDEIPITSTEHYSLNLNLTAAKKINVEIPFQVLRSASRLIK